MTGKTPIDNVPINHQSVDDLLTRMIIQTAVSIQPKPGRASMNSNPVIKMTGIVSTLSLIISRQSIEFARKRPKK